MGNDEHMKLIRSCSVAEWNDWRAKNLRIAPDLTRIDLSNRDLTGIDFRGAGLFKVNLTNATLVDSNLRQTRIIQSKLDGAILDGSFVYGASVWDVSTEGSSQKDLVVSPPKKPVISVDNLEVAQFIYLLTNNSKLRGAIDSITSKAVLILGRFTKKRKKVLDLIRDELREAGFLPILFDFDPPSSITLTETVRTMAMMSRFVIIDLSEPRCSPHELATLAGTISAPIFPLLHKSEGKPYAMFEDFRKLGQVEGLISYESSEDVKKRVLPEVLKQAALRK